MCIFQMKNELEKNKIYTINYFCLLNAQKIMFFQSYIYIYILLYVLKAIYIHKCIGYI